jgi:ubiquinone/menaquinone biosynthesis C-methylase UbiE
MAFQDHFSTQAGQYTRFRPRYPRELFEYLASLPHGRSRAWDCGTGNGQAACDLARWFDEVVATDPSQNQISHAVAHPKVKYLVATAEHSPLADGSVDLVTAAQALHWFDLERFYAEVRRVGRPGSVLCAWSYGLARITPEVDAAVWTLYHDILGAYWPPERKIVEEGYSTVPFPFEQVSTPRFTMSARWSFADLVGYLGTWSSTQAYLKRHGSDPVELVRDELQAAWGAADRPNQVRWPLVLRAGWVS